MPGSLSEHKKTVGISFDTPLSITPSQLALYEKCPRRFLYAHVLKLGGRRTESAFMKMHAAVQNTIDEFVDPDNPMLTEVELEALYKRHWDARGPVDHGYANDYERVGRQLLTFLFDLRRTETPQPISDLTLNIAGAQIIVRPDERTTRSEQRVTVILLYNQGLP